ncbi:MAG: hypothetical protein ACOCWQ_05025 [Nanoarchaeota archaeon]
MSKSSLWDASLVLLGGFLVASFLVFAVGRDLRAVDSLLMLGLLLVLSWLVEQSAISGYAYISVFFFVPHLIGMFGLYAQVIAYDLVAHTVSMILLAPLVFELMPQPGLLSRFIFVVLVLLGIGSLHEIGEYAGHCLFGWGEGILQTGSGDFSEGVALWQNMIHDMIANLLGAIIGGGIMCGKAYKQSSPLSGNASQYHRGRG